MERIAFGGSGVVFALSSWRTTAFLGCRAFLAGLFGSFGVFVLAGTLWRSRAGRPGARDDEGLVIPIAMVFAVR